MLLSKCSLKIYIVSNSVKIDALIETYFTNIVCSSKLCSMVS